MQTHHTPIEIHDVNLLFKNTLKKVALNLFQTITMGVRCPKHDCLLDMLPDYEVVCPSCYESEMKQYGL